MSLQFLPRTPTLRDSDSIAKVARFHRRLLRAGKTHEARALTPYEILIGLRYARARRGSGRNGFMSVVALASMAGIALGVWALIVVLSVMNGFQDEVRNRLLAAASHIEIRGLGGGIADWPEIAGIARKNVRVQGVAPYVLGQAMLSAGDINRGDADTRHRPRPRRYGRGSWQTHARRRDVRPSSG